MLLRLCIVALCVSFASLSAGQTPWDGPQNDRKDRSVAEGSGAGGSTSWPDGINDDEDDPRGRSGTITEGSGAGGAGAGVYDEDREEDTRRVSEGSGDGAPAETYPKPNRNDDSGWQTPWEPATKSEDPPGTTQDKKPKADDDDDDFSMPGSTNSKPAPAPGNDVSIVGGEGKKAAGEDVHIVGHGTSNDRPASFFAQPGILAAVIGGVVVGLLCTVLLLMYIVYRMRKMDEGSYPLEEPRKNPSNKQSQEFFA